MAEIELQSAPSQPVSSVADDEVTFLDFLVVLAKNKRLILGLPLAAGIVALAGSLLLPNWYTATAKILLPQQAQSSALAVLGQLGGLAGGASQALGIKNPGDTYVAMLKSRSVADRVIEKFALKKVYGEELLHDARMELTRNSSIASGRDGVITIAVEDKDPARAADLANAYVEELRTLTDLLAVTEAGQRRLFFEGQLKKAKDDLTASELALKKFTQDAGLINPEGQINLSVAAAAALRAQIAAKEIQLSAMRTFATDSNPELRRALRELASLRGELAKMEMDTNASKGDIMVPFGKAPEVGLEYLRRFRDMKYFETLFEMLAKQYEIARIDEAHEATLIQVLDRAIPPERKSRPRRALIFVSTLVAGLVLSIGLALVWEALQRIRRDQSSPKYRELLSLLAKRKLS